MSEKPKKRSLSSLLMSDQELEDKYSPKSNNSEDESVGEEGNKVEHTFSNIAQEQDEVRAIAEMPSVLQREVAKGESGLESYFLKNAKFSENLRENMPVFSDNHQKLLLAVQAFELEKKKKYQAYVLLNNIIEEWFAKNKNELDRIYKKNTKNIF